MYYANFIVNQQNQPQTKMQSIKAVQLLFRESVLNAHTNTHQNNTPIYSVWEVSK